MFVGQHQFGAGDLQQAVFDAGDVLHQPSQSDAAETADPHRFQCFGAEAEIIAHGEAEEGAGPGESGNLAAAIGHGFEQAGSACGDIVEMIGLFAFLDDAVPGGDRRCCRNGGEAMKILIRDRVANTYRSLFAF